MVNFPFTLSLSVSYHQTNAADNNPLVHYRNYIYGLHLNSPPSISIKQPFRATVENIVLRCDPFCWSDLTANSTWNFANSTESSIIIIRETTIRHGSLTPQSRSTGKWTIMASGPMQRTIKNGESPRNRPSSNNNWNHLHRFRSLAQIRLLADLLIYFRLTFRDYILIKSHRLRFSATAVRRRLSQ